MTDVVRSPSGAADAYHVDYGELRARVVTTTGDKWPVTILFDSQDHADGARLRFPGPFEGQYRGPLGWSGDLESSTIAPQLPVHHVQRRRLQRTA